MALLLTHTKNYAHSLRLIDIYPLGDSQRPVLKEKKDLITVPELAG